MNVLLLNFKTLKKMTNLYTVHLQLTPAIANARWQLRQLHVSLFAYQSYGNVA